MLSAASHPSRAASHPGRRAKARKGSINARLYRHNLVQWKQGPD
jgi:hypothetical protein